VASALLRSQNVLQVCDVALGVRARRYRTPRMFSGANSYSSATFFTSMSSCPADPIPSASSAFRTAVPLDEARYAAIFDSAPAAGVGLLKRFYILTNRLGLGLAHSRNALVVRGFAVCIASRDLLYQLALLQCRSLQGRGFHR